MPDFAPALPALLEWAFNALWIALAVLAVLFVLADILADAGKGGGNNDV